MEQRTRKKQSVLFNVLCVILAILLMIGIAFIVARIVHKTGGATVEHGLSAYELAEKYGYEGSLQEWLESLKGKFNSNVGNIRLINITGRLTSEPGVIIDFRTTRLRGVRDPQADDDAEQLALWAGGDETEVAR